MDELETLNAAFEKAKAAGDTVKAKEFAQAIVSFQELSGSDQKPESYGEPIVEDGQYQIGGDVSKLGIAGELVAAPVEAAMALGSGMAADTYGDMVGGVRYATDPVSAPGIAADTKEMLTYQPRTQGGKDIMQTFSEKMKWLSDIAEKPSEWGQQIYEDVPEGETAGPIREAVARNVAGLTQYGSAAVAGAGFRAPTKTVPSGASTSSLYKNAKNLYKQVDNSDIQINRRAYTPFKNRLLKDLSEANVTISDYPKLSKAIKKIDRYNSPTLKQLGSIKRNLQGAIKSRDAGDVFYANKIDTTISDLIKDLKPQNVSGRGRHNIGEIGRVLDTADDLWHRMQQGKELENMYTKARRSSDVTKYGNWDEALSNKSRALLDSDARSLGMDPEVLTQLDDLVIGGNKRQLARIGAEMAPASSSARGAAPVTVSTALAAGGGYAAAGATGAILTAGLPMAAGYIFKKLGNYMTKKEFARIQDAIINKGHPVALKMIDELAQKYKVSLAAPAYSAATTEPEGTSLSDMIP